MTPDKLSVLELTSLLSAFFAATSVSAAAIYYLLDRRRERLSLARLVHCRFLEGEYWNKPANGRIRTRPASVVVTNYSGAPIYDLSTILVRRKFHEMVFRNDLISMEDSFSEHSTLPKYEITGTDTLSRLENSEKSTFPFGVDPRFQFHYEPIIGFTDAKSRSWIVHLNRDTQSSRLKQVRRSQWGLLALYIDNDLGKWRFRYYTLRKFISYTKLRTAGASSKARQWLKIKR